MMIFDIVADVMVDVDFLEVVAVDVELVYLHYVLDSIGMFSMMLDGHRGWMTPKPLISILAPEARIFRQMMWLHRW